MEKKKKKKRAPEVNANDAECQVGGDFSLDSSWWNPAGPLFNDSLALSVFSGVLLPLLLLLLLLQTIVRVIETPTASS